MKTHVSATMGTVMLVAVFASTAFAGGLFVYDGFDYTPGAAIDGSAGGFGWNGDWSTSGGNPHVALSSGNTFGALPVNGNSAQRSGAPQRSTLSRNLPASLFADNTSVWFGVLLDDNNQGGVRSNARLGFALSSSDLEVQNEPQFSTGTDAIGFELTNDGAADAIVSSWLDGGTSSQQSASTIDVGEFEEPTFLVGRIDWGTADTGDASNHTISLWELAETELGTGPTTPGVSLAGVNIDQSAFDRLTMVDNKQIVLDEIRFAPTFDDLVGETVEFTPVPEPVSIAIWLFVGLGVCCLFGFRSRKEG